MKCLNFLFYVFLLLGTLTMFASVNLGAEILIHFCMQFFIAALFFLVLYSALKEKKKIIASSLITIYFLSILALSFKAPEISTHKNFEDITILQFNANYRNENTEKTILYIKSLDEEKSNAPDIVLIQEATVRTKYKLNELTKDYPYVIDDAQEGPYGMLIYSKIPIEHAFQQKFDLSWNKYTVLHLKTPKKKMPFVLYELHATSPAHPAHLAKIEQRKHELNSIAEIISADKIKNVILVGDLNTTPYSPYFRTLEKISGLRNSMRGNYLWGSWPNFLPFFMRIPLDHVLVSQKMKITHRTVETDLGSDHMPILTQIRINAD
jgi:endonuclease/exonuclease/phosphatase (EEP) superfamily protein YafD